MKNMNATQSLGQEYKMTLDALMSIATILEEGGFNNGVAALFGVHHNRGEIAVDDLINLRLNGKADLKLAQKEQALISAGRKAEVKAALLKWAASHFNEWCDFGEVKNWCAKEMRRFLAEKDFIAAKFLGNKKFVREVVVAAHGKVNVRIIVRHGGWTFEFRGKKIAVVRDE